MTLNHLFRMCNLTARNWPPFSIKFESNVRRVATGNRKALAKAIQTMKQTIPLKRAAEQQLSPNGSLE